ncbi:MAG: ATP-binding protein [Thermodesulfobacteriota bacterium]|nr:ATP-binding protein [Thermodesulfobacteriota bacterium]
MKIKLAYKIFWAFLITSLITIVLMTGIMRYTAQRHFTHYVNKMESEILKELAGSLKTVYSKHQGWEYIIENPHVFRGILRSASSQNNFRQRHHPALPRDAQIRPDNDRVPPMPLQHKILKRISLFDEQKHLVKGSAASTSDHILQKITVDGKTVGWLGLRERQKLSGPQEKAFLYEQSKAFLLIGFFVLILAALVSLLLSRHLLRPVEELAKGSRALASRRFDTRIKVSSGDELGQVAHDFNKMAQTLERYEHLRKQWISDISHELRTPIAILRGEIEAILDGVREMSTQTLESIHAEVMLLEKLIHDLHELSIAETGTLSSKKEPVEVLQILAHTVKHFEPRLKQKNIHLQIDLGEDFNITVQGDRDRMAQVFSNILENAIRYTETPGELRIWQERSGTSLHVNIEDSKPGVSDDALVHLFDRLYRTDSSRSRKIGGSGLGLAICKGIVEMFAGEIHASHSSLGGVRIEIVLPLTKTPV